MNVKNPITYDEKIIRAFQLADEENGHQGASPAEVTEMMARHSWLANLDTVIDIERLMKRLRNEGRL